MIAKPISPKHRILIDKMSRSRGVAALACLSLLPAAARAYDDAGLSLFKQGRIQGSLTAGYGEFHDNNYFIAGLGGGYFVANGLETDVNADAWLGSRPQIYDVSPQIRYIFLHLFDWKPYIGALYRRTFYTHTFPAIDSAGARAGFVYPVSPNAYLNVGAVYEHYFNCDTGAYTRCDQVYPELGVAFSL